MMLLTTSKVCLRHPDCQSARENRDTVFAQMRRAIDLIHFVVKEGVITAAKSALPLPSGSSGNLMSMMMMTSSSGVGGDEERGISANNTNSGVIPPSSSSTAPHHFIMSSHHHHQRPNSSSSSSSSLNLSSFNVHHSTTAHNESSSVFYGGGGRSPTPHASSSHSRPTSRNNDQLIVHGDMLQIRSQSIPKYQRRGQLHRAQQTVPGGSFVLAVESTLKWLHEQLDSCSTIINFLRRVHELLDLARMGPLNGGVREQIAFSLEAAIERTQDFTDSAYTSHEHREKILLLSDQTKVELATLFQTATTTAFCMVSFLHDYFLLHYNIAFA